MNNSTHIELDDDVREHLGNEVGQTPKKEKHPATQSEPVKALYKISNALRYCEPAEFESDEAAWEGLRGIFNHTNEDGTVSGRFMWLWKEKEVEVTINNEEEFIREYNEAYGPCPYGYGPDNAELMKAGEVHKTKVWIPILQGLTNHPYNIKTK